MGSCEDNPESAADGGGIVMFVGPAHGPDGPVAKFLDERLDMVGNRICELQDQILCSRQVDTAVKARPDGVQIQFVCIPIEQHSDPVCTAPCN